MNIWNMPPDHFCCSFLLKIQIYIYDTVILTIVHTMASPCTKELISFVTSPTETDVVRVPERYFSEAQIGKELFLPSVTVTAFSFISKIATARCKNETESLVHHHLPSCESISIRTMPVFNVIFTAGSTVSRVIVYCSSGSISVSLVIIISVHIVSLTLLYIGIFNTTLLTPMKSVPSVGISLKDAVYF